MANERTKLYSAASGYNSLDSSGVSHRFTAEKIFQNDKRIHEKLSIEHSAKLGTYNGVFLPTALNVLSILMFLRFGLIVGQLGVVGALFTLMLCYSINLLTTLSVSAIATNGIVRTGGAYYMISRSLGPEFGGSIGLIFYFGQVLNSALNVVGLIEPLINNFGQSNGKIANWLPESYAYSILYSTLILFICVAISLVGADLVSKAAVLLFFILIASIISIPVSAIFVSPFNVPGLDSFYSGLSWSTFVGNLMPHFTKHAAGSQMNSKENFADLFGIFFPATAGILAGASMSGSLKNPSASIPSGTLSGLLVTFICYAVVIVSMGASIPRDLLHKDVLVVQTVSFAQVIIILGEVSTALFSVIMGVVGAAEILAAISKDAIIPGLTIFNNKKNNPVKAILFSWILIQGFLFANINQIATLITMAFLMTFIVINVACFLLEISAAPNFRPSFAYFNRTTAVSGVLSCFGAMFIVDGLSASMVIFCLLFLIIFIHYVCPPKPWGDVSQTLIYHQVRKYLFKLRQDNIKYWRPQILLLVDNPRTCWNLMQFCNHLKKGGLYILGHVIVSTKDSFEDNFDGYVKEKKAWVKLRDMLSLKAFVQFSVSTSLPWGVKNIFLGSGLGSMKPNIIVIGFLDLSNQKSFGGDSAGDPVIDPKSIERFNPAYNLQVTASDVTLPTDACKRERRIKITEWVQSIEELLLMNANVAVAKGFPRLEIPGKFSHEVDEEDKRIIDLYPIQMSAEIADKSGKTILSTNFDTYTLILQLGAILTTVPQWKKTHRLRIVVFVEENKDVEEERARVDSLISVLRINAEIIVKAFNSGEFGFYNYIVKNQCLDKKVAKKVNKALQNNEWWQEISALRSQHDEGGNLNNVMNLNSPVSLDNSIADHGKSNITLSRLQRLGVKLNMRTNRLLHSHIHENSPAYSSESDADDEFGSDGYDSDPGSKLQKAKPSSLANEKRMRRSTFSNNAGRGGNRNDVKFSREIITSPKSPIFEKTSAKFGTKQEENGETKHLKRPAVSRQGSMHSYTSLRSYAKPNFSSQSMPKSKVNEEACGNEPSFMFTEDDNESVKSRASSGKTKKTRKAEDSKRKNEEGNVKKPVETEASGYSETSNSQFLTDSGVSSDSANEQTVEDVSDEEFDINDLTFNVVPARAQHMILNQLMMKLSKNSSIIFSTLPTPPSKCHKSTKSSVEYVETLDLWCKGLPPVFLINSRTMTVTTAL